MIAFDNGPKGGDYVRYIDTLLANRATPSPPTPKHDLVDDFGPSAMDSATPTTSSQIKRPDARGRAAERGRSSTAITPAQANAMADELLMRTTNKNAAALPTDVAALVPAVVPLVAAIAGAILVVTSSGVIALLGLGLVVWAISTFVKRVTTLRARWTSGENPRSASEATRIASIDWK